MNRLHLVITMSQSNSIKKGLITLFLTLLASITSSLCCLGPLLYLVFGVSAAGLTSIPALSWLQVPMIVIASGLLIQGFWRLYISPYPTCENKISRKVLIWLYWASVPVSLVMMAYPFVFLLDFR